MDFMETDLTSDEAPPHEVAGGNPWCNIESNGAAARQQGASDLQRHLVQSIDKPNCSDVVFVCKDENHVHALKFFCRRSYVLCARIEGSMSECNSATVQLPEMKSSTLLSILEYLYTGDILHYRPKDWKMGFEVIAAARHFMLSPSVEPIVEAILLKLLENEGRDLPQLAKMLSMALEYNLSHLNLVGGIVHLLRSTWMEEECACHLTEDAVDLILQRTKVRRETGSNRIKLSLDEYFRFRGVVKWALCRSGLAKRNGTKVLLDEVIPVARRKLCRLGRADVDEVDLVWLPGYEVDHTKLENEIAPCLDECKRVLVRLLAIIDWAQIPSTFLNKIITPLKLVEESVLLKALFHILSSSGTSFRLNWVHGSSIDVLDSRRGFGLQRRRSRTRGGGGGGGLAVCELLSNTDDTFSEWSYGVEALSGSIQLEVIFCQDRADVMSWNFEESVLATMDDESQGRVTRTLSLQPDGLDSVLCIVDGPTHRSVRCSTNSLTVKFQVDHSTRQCSVMVASQNLEAVWTNLPCQNFFPAVCVR